MSRRLSRSRGPLHPKTLIDRAEKLVAGRQSRRKRIVRSRGLITLVVALAVVTTLATLVLGKTGRGAARARTSSATT